MTSIPEEDFFDVEGELRSMGHAQGGELFRGDWARRNPFGIPGPIYVGDDDACGYGVLSAPFNVYTGDFDLDLATAPFGLREFAWGEFLIRQPSSRHELLQVVEAANGNPVAAYAMDGNSHWTAKSVAQWWQEAKKVRQHLESRPDLDAPDQLWLFYLSSYAETYLRRYVAFLTTGKVPAADDALPELLP